ncbi:MAG: hypothetical protein ACYDA3_03725 [Gaiellaceae bacterium]
MIAADDRVFVAPGVTIDGEDVVDTVRALRLPANATARTVLSHADGRTIAEVGGVLDRNGAHDGARDALEFCGELNRRLFVNVRIRRLALVRRRLAAARAGIVILHAPPVRTTGVLRGVVPCALALAALTLPLSLAVGAWQLAPVVGGGVLLHELGHAAALAGIPRAVVRRGLRPALVHPSLSGLRALAVGAAGPLAPALAALGTVVVSRAAAPACLPLAAHALALTMVSPDGRNACGLS